MDTKGRHLIIDAFECDGGMLNDAKKLSKLLTGAINDLGMEILSTNFHTFTPQGVTGVIGISTSHFSIHTWPEKGYAALDLYTCGDQAIWPALKSILNKLKAKRADIYELIRGEEGQPMMKRLTLSEGKSQSIIQLRNDRGNEWDMKQLREIVAGNHNILYHGKSKFQDILLVEANDLRLYLNQELQFCSLDERYYHEALVLPVMETAMSRERVLILGGGDGLALREVLKYKDVKHVDLVDIDSMMIELAKTNSALLAQNNRSFLDKRVKVQIEDAKKFLAKKHQPYDVIIIDFPDPVDSMISSLYTKELFSKVAGILSKDGALVCQSNSPEDAPRSYWSVGKTLAAAGLKPTAYNVIVPSFGLWGFFLASHNGLKGKPQKISVPHQALSSNLSTLFEIPASVTEEQLGSFINSEKNLKLHELFQLEIKQMY